MNWAHRIFRDNAAQHRTAEHHSSRPWPSTWIIGWVELCTFITAPRQVNGGDRVWLLIDTQTAVAQVMAGDKTLARYDNIAIGRRGAVPLHLAGDDTTPLGTYHVNAIRRGGSYRLFINLAYPTVGHATLALAQRKITRPHYLQIIDAHEYGRLPPATTPLGGAIGIHGVGGGSLRIHRQFNWTHGCVALDNAQIADLANHLKIGTRVVIR